jgi:hypothetical protein
MIKIISFSIASMILIQSFNIHVLDVLKLKNLIEHIEFHKSTYGDNVFAFVAKHYGYQKLKHEKKDEKGDHQQLPFHHNTCFDSVVFYVFDMNRYQLKDLDHSDAELSTFFFQSVYSFMENTDIFQPPQFV